MILGLAGGAQGAEIPLLPHNFLERLSAIC